MYDIAFQLADMISKLNSKSPGVIKEVKPHYSFSYAKGVVFDQDLYELSVDEILEMCDTSVWKVFKVPRTNMIIFTFHNDQLPEYLYTIENERFPIRPYKPKPLQCFRCFGYGHSSKVCRKDDQLCAVCSLEQHEGVCSSPMLCVNCKEEHNARSRECRMYKKELAAVEKAHVEHISVGHAKRLLFPRPQYNEAARSNK